MAVIGKMTCYSPVVPKNKADFINGNVENKKDQKWVRNFPTDAELTLKSEIEREAIIAKELDRREEGCWFLNNGFPTYLTGDHYDYLVHNLLPDGNYPQYRDADQEDYWWWRAIELDENCIGGVFAGARQRGKSARTGQRCKNYATLNPNVEVGIQSKNDTDASKLFQKFVVTPWRKMSAYLRPKSASGDDPKTELSFRARQRTGKAAEGPAVAALDSLVGFRSSTVNAYDNATLARYLMDEAFKKQDGSSAERQEIVSRMMWRADKAIAKMALYSTVDEQEAFDPVICEKIWLEASTTLENAPERTINGLTPLFMPAYRAHLVDEYGRCRIEDSIKSILAKAPSDPVSRRKYFRAWPMNEDDMFAAGAKETTFNLENLDAAKANNRRQFEETGKYYWRQVDLVWDDPDTRMKVKTVDNAVNGRFKVIMQALPPNLNEVFQKGFHTSILGTFPKLSPGNATEFAIGCDPYDSETVRDLGAASRGAAYCFWKPDLLHEAERLDGLGNEKPGYWPSDSFIVEYVNRPPRTQDFYEDMIKLCHFFGSPFLPERNKPGVIAHFEKRGYGDFLRGKVPVLESEERHKRGKRKIDDTPGHAAGTGTTNQWSEKIDDYTHGPLGDDPRRMPFQHQIKDVIALDVKKTQKYDAAVATGWTLLEARRKARLLTPPPPRDSYRLSSFLNV